MSDLEVWQGPAIMSDVLVFHPALAPYRVRFFNWLAQKADTHVVFLQRQVSSQAFSRAVTFDRLEVRYSFIERALLLAGRVLPLGVSTCLRRHAPKVVIATEFSLVTLWLCGMRRRYGYRLLSIIDEAAVQIQSASLMKRVVRWLELKALDGIIVLSDDARMAFRDVGYKGSIVVAPMVQDECELRGNIEEAYVHAQRYRETYNLKQKVILYVGRLAPEKNLGFLVKSFAHLRKTHNFEAKMVLVGEGAERHSIAQLAKQLGVESDTLMPGRKEGDELYAWYLVADVFVLPSMREPYGAVVNESLVFGLPVVCSDQAGAAALIESRKQGMKVSVDDPEVFARAVMEVLNEGRSEGSLMPFSFQDSQREFGSLLERLLQ